MDKINEYLNRTKEVRPSAYDIVCIRPYVECADGFRIKENSLSR